MGMNASCACDEESDPKRRLRRGRQELTAFINQDRTMVLPLTREGTTDDATEGSGGEDGSNEGAGEENGRG